MENDYSKPKKWSESDIRAVARNTYYNQMVSYQRTIEEYIRKEARSYISQDDVIKMLMSLADALGYEIKKVAKEYEAVKKVK